MKLSKDTKILILGLGLMGGSYAKALTERGFEVGAVARRQETIDYALAEGIIAHGRADIDPEYISRFDLLIFAMYPHGFVEWIENYQQYIRSGAIISDVTGVKCSIIYKIQDILRPDLEYIGAHPMAGRECSGVENAKSEIFEGANYIVTPTGKNTPEAIELCKDLGRVMGFRMIAELTPEKHDEMIGFLSQLAHCIAVSLMVCKDSKHLVDYTGDSFRDLTRIAKINDEMWSELFLLNRDELVRQMDLFSENFTLLRDSIAGGDRETIRRMMRLSTERRKYFDVEKEDETP
jgi:prephenate dehydrogenase